MRHKVGDKVKIIHNYSCHGFDIGDVVTIESIDGPDYCAYDTYEESYWFTDEDCEPVNNSITLKIKQL